MASTDSLVEQRFYAAVNVIRGLPKNGSYQPSNDMQLRFYSYFKQATEGRCNQKRPGIWNPVARYKWEAWTRLGSMPKEEAMNNYVGELKKIIETMSYTDNVADFMGSISELDGVSVEDLEAVAPEAIQKVRSQPNSPFESREASPVRVPTHHQNGQVNGGEPVLTNGHNHNGGVLNEAIAVMNGNGGAGGSSYYNGHTTTEQSDDEYIDTIDDYDTHSFTSDSTGVTTTTNKNNHASRTKVRYQPVQEGQNIKRIVGQVSTSGGPPPSLEVDLRFHNVLSQLNITVERINLDVQQVMTRMAVVERSLNEAAKSRNSLVSSSRKRHPKWWPFKELSPNWVIFIVLWPFVAHKLMNAMSRRRK